jgi:acetyltransferase-like isoleucine patch superfamily enzyme
MVRNRIPSISVITKPLEEMRYFRSMAGWLLRGIKLWYLRSSGVTIGQHTFVSFGAKIDVGRGRVFIGNNCVITYGCIILSHDHAATDLLRTVDSENPITYIEDGVFIGMNSIILPGRTIGRNAIIGAGSVVTHDIPAGVVAAGNPARIIRSVVSQVSG